MMLGKTLIRAALNIVEADLRVGSTAQKINVPLTGVQKVELQTSDGGDGNGNDHGDWADTQFQWSG